MEYMNGTTWAYLGVGYALRSSQEALANIDPKWLETVGREVGYG